VNPLRSSNGRPSTASCVAKKVWIHGAADTILICTQRHTTPAQPQPRGPLPGFDSIHRCYALMFLFPSRNPTTLAQPCSNLCISVWDCTFRYAFTGAARACTTALSADGRQLGPQVTRVWETSHPWYGFSLAMDDVHDPCLVHLFLEATADDIHSSQLCATSRATSRTPPVEERPGQLLPHMARSCAKMR